MSALSTITTTPVNHDPVNHDKGPSKDNADWASPLKTINKMMSPFLFYIKFPCKVASNLPATKKLVAPIKKLIKYPNSILQTIKLILGLKSLQRKEIGLDLKRSTKILTLFKKTLKFYAMIASTLSLKKSGKITKINIALSTILPFLNLLIKLKDEKLSSADLGKSLYKIGKALLSVYLLTSQSTLNKSHALAITVTDFTLAHI